MEHYRVKRITENGKPSTLTIDDEEFFENFTDLIAVSVSLKFEFSTRNFFCYLGPSPAFFVLEINVTLVLTF